MNIVVEQILIIILIVFLLYFVMNKCSCNIEGIDTCPSEKVDKCIGQFGNCNNLYTEGEFGGGYHKCRYLVAAFGFPPIVDGYLPCEPDTSADCKISNPCSVWGEDNCVDVRSLELKIGGTRRIAGQDEKNGKIKSVNFNYYVDEGNPALYKTTPRAPYENYATILYSYENGTTTEERYDKKGRYLWDGNNYVEENNTDKDNDRETWNICVNLFQNVGITYFSIDINNFEVHRGLRTNQTLRVFDGSGNYYDINENVSIGTKNFKTDPKIEFFVIK